MSARYIKITGLNLLKNTGLFEVAKLLFRKQVKILAYHRFGERHLPAEIFERQIRYLMKHYNIIDLESFMIFLQRRKELPPNCVILTIDDGYHDFYTEAFSILKKYNVPAIVFLTTDFINKKMWLWHDLLNFGISNTSRVDFTLNGHDFDLTDRSHRSQLKLALDRICTSCGTTERNVFINQFLRELRVKAPKRPTSNYAPLTWEQILEMSEFGVTYGAHTCTHPILSKISPQQALHEIRESKSVIEEVIQKSITGFCYPNGTENDFNEKVKNIVKKCGFSCAMSMIYGMNNLESDTYALRRMAVDGRSYIYFVHDVSGFGVLRRSLCRRDNKLA